MPRRPDPIGSDSDLAASIATRGEHGTGSLTGLIFGIWCHRIFQVEDQRIRPAGQGLGQFAGVVAWNEEQ